MLDINFIKENKEEVIQNAIARSVKVDINLILRLHAKIVGVKQNIEKLNQRKNQINKEISNNNKKDQHIEEIKKIKIWNAMTAS